MNHKVLLTKSDKKGLSRCKQKKYPFDRLRDTEAECFK
jgi:hypothetical protein